MKKAFIVILLFICFSYKVTSVEECYFCEDKENYHDCMKKKTACVMPDDRCLKLKYRNANENMAYDARCSRETECNALGDPLCNLKKDCQIEQCCETELCNSHAFSIRSNIRLLSITVVIATIILVFIK